MPSITSPPSNPDVDVTPEKSCDPQALPDQSPDEQDERALDEALTETFPASDPISVTFHPGSLSRPG